MEDRNFCKVVKSGEWTRKEECRIKGKNKKEEEREH